MWFTEFHSISNFKKSKKKNERKNKIYLDNSEVYCLSDFEGLHSNLIMVTDYSIHNNNNSNLEVLYFIRKSISLARY